MRSDLQWGGRFAQAPDADLLAFGSSLEEDLPLAACDVRCSLAHVEALAGGGVLSGDDAQALRAALERVAEEIAAGSFTAWALEGAFEDVHGAIDARVRELAGEAGARLHAGRSRNDQVATTLLLYAREQAEGLAGLVRSAARRLVDAAEEELDAGTLVPGMTHWQHAQPIALAFWLHAWATALARDARRLDAAAREARSVCPLGSAALAGSTLPLDRMAAARALGFTTPSHNALDAIGNRDAALDVLHAATRALLTASRCSEELVIWMTQEFGFARLDDRASTGSSLMPQKKNPDVFELVRARGGTAIGILTGALATLKGVASSYQRDLQETKAAVVRGLEHARAVVFAFERALGYVRFDRERCNARAAIGFAVATDVADALVLAGLPTRVAHERVGRAVAKAEAEGRELEASDLKELGVEAPLDGEASVAAKRTIGSTNPDQIRIAIAALREEL
ncbi:MAG TPA: argininosuccinate lyase [Candidatus Dormibacteraeota bacterium]|nr:argininosuccinate lyase [Candidatus Dormibacteraeota bacterium]